MNQKFFNITLAFIVLLQWGILIHQTNVISLLTDVSSDCLQEIKYLHERIRYLESEKAAHSDEEELDDEREQSPAIVVS